MRTGMNGNRTSQQKFSGKKNKIKLFDNKQKCKLQLLQRGLRFECNKLKPSSDNIQSYTQIES